MRIALVGAGLAGLACANRLTEAGHRVALFDKGRGPGGRMATRRVSTLAGEVSFDHGAQYFTTRDDGFRAQIARWQEAGLVAPWPAAGAQAWVGVPAMNAPLKHLAAGLDVRWSAQVASVAREAGGWRLLGAGLDEAGFDALVVAVPAEQAAPLLAPWDADAAALAGATRSEPCWTVMAAFAARLPAAADMFRGGAVVDWAARNSAKPGRTGPESWVIHASPAWSRDHLEQGPEAIVPLLLEALFRCLDVPAASPMLALAHRWRYARSGAADRSLLWNAGQALGVCGDWLLGPRVESAWVSGTRLADTITGRGAD